MPGSFAIRNFFRSEKKESTTATKQATSKAKKRHSVRVSVSLGQSLDDAATAAVTFVPKPIPIRIHLPKPSHLHPSAPYLRGFHYALSLPGYANVIEVSI